MEMILVPSLVVVIIFLVVTNILVVKRFRSYRASWLEQLNISNDLRKVIGVFQKASNRISPSQINCLNGATPLPAIEAPEVDEHQVRAFVETLERLLEETHEDQ